MGRERFVPRPAAVTAQAEPFPDSESAWFWFVEARQAQLGGARVSAGLAARARPCEPLDVLAVVDRLFRRRRLLREHMAVLAEYGQRLLRPDASAPSEARAARLWDEAFRALDPALRAKGIVA